MGITVIASGSEARACPGSNAAGSRFPLQVRTRRSSSLAGFPLQSLTRNSRVPIPPPLSLSWKLLLASMFSGLALLSIGQDPPKLKIDKWMEKNRIKLNAPVPPAGFTFFYDCRMKPAYRRVSGDTITLYTWGGNLAERLDTFKETFKSPDFNVFRYPSKTQTNETVIVERLTRRDFLWRNDTLYVLDSYNKERATRSLKLMEDHWAKNLSDEEYEAQMKDLDGQDFGFVSKYKAIYFTGIFDNGKSYTFSVSQNFRLETVHWTGASFSEGKKIFEIKLDTHTDGRYRFSEDMMMLETANCFR